MIHNIKDAARRAVAWGVWMMRVAKALALDTRFPRPLRWIVRVALAMKVVPVPDFGIDEVLLLIVGGILWIFYRPLLLTVITETRPVRGDKEE